MTNGKGIIYTACSYTYVGGGRQIMIIQISSALKHPGQSFPFSVSGSIEKIDVYGDQINIENPISIEGSIMYTGEDFFVRGNFSANYTAHCGLCGKEVTNKIECEFNEEFCITEDLSHPDRFTYVGNTIDISKMVLDNIYLKLPLKLICNQECQGLCPTCGQNLNVAQCECNNYVQKSSSLDKEAAINKKDNPFAVLENLFNDEEEEV